MPIPMTICSICGKTVVKKQTLAIADGKRACKSHSDTKEQSATFQADKADKKKQLDRELWNKKFKQMPSPSSILSINCAICGKPGAMYHQLINEPKENLNKEFLFTVVFSQENNNKITIPRKAYTLAKMSEQLLGPGMDVMPVCCTCCNNYGLMSNELATAREYNHEITNEMVIELARDLALSRTIVDAIKNDLQTKENQ